MAITKKNITCVSSYTHAVVFGENPVLIGERINPTGKKRFKEALKANDIDYILKEYGKSKDVNQFELDKRCGIKFEVYSHPVYTEYQTSLETLIQVLRITEALDHE